jgi:predicted amidohydrolase YtcJ
VLSANLFAIPPAQIAEQKVVLTLLDGKVVFEDESLRR